MCRFARIVLLTVFCTWATVARGMPLVATGIAVSPAMSASWYNPDEAGHGIMIHLLDEERAWMCWFTFDANGNPAWICALGTVEGDSLVFEQAFTVEGGAFPPLFDPAMISEQPWGSITVTFSGCDTGEMTWTTEAEAFASGQMPLVRLTSLWGSECENPQTGNVLYIPRSSLPVIVDGHKDDGEWDDGIEVSIVINSEWTVPVRLKTDGQNLFALFSNIGGPNDENRVGAARPTTTFPEIFLDLTPVAAEEYDNGNHWFHVSFQDCYQNGFFASANNCAGSLPGWTANNWPLADSVDHTEISISYERLNLAPNQPHMVSLFVTMTSSLLGNNDYFSWPPEAVAHQPVSWHLAEIL